MADEDRVPDGDPNDPRGAPARSAAPSGEPLPFESDPLWYKDAVIYQLHVRAFFDSNDDGVGDFKGLCDKLDYIARLGVNAIWLLPFYPSPLRDDGYDIADYLDIHPAYGSKEDFHKFVDEAHRRGLKVITELVVNHTSDQHPWFQRARAAPRGSREREFYVWSDTDQRFPETRIIFSDTEASNWAWDPVAGQYYWHRFFTHQPDLNHNNPEVVKAVIRVMKHWLDLGVDGLRLDAIPYLCVRDGTTNENLPETHAVVKQIRAAIDAEYPNRMLLAEANQWPEDVRDYFADGDECHMAYHFPLMPRMYMAIAQEDRYPIVEILQQTPDIPANCQWAIFLRNHDELTLEMVTDRERDYMYQAYAADARARVNVGIRRRLAPLMENDLGKIQLMNSLLLSMPGSPTVYYGDELGMGDNIYLGDRNGVRTPMQWSSDRNGGFSRADPQGLYLPPIMDPIYGYASVNVEAQSREPSSLLNWTRRILAVRKSFKAFGRGTFELLKPGNRKILAYVRRYGNEVILCVTNLKRSAQAVELDLAEWKGRVPVELLGRSSFPPIGDLPYMLTLAGHGFYWFELAESASVPSWHEERLAPEEKPWLVLFDGLRSFEPAAAGERRVVAERLFTQLERDVVPAYLAGQRWFAAKERGAASVKLEGISRWSGPRGTWLLTIADASFERGEPQRYFLPLALDWGPERASSQAAHAVARVRERARIGLLSDAFAHPDFVRDAVSALITGEPVACLGGEVRFESTRALEGLLPEDVDAAEVKLAADSSNFAVLIGRKLFLKAFRRLREGVHPEWEMGRFLTERSPCAAVVPTAGALVLTRPGAEDVTVALVQAAVRNQGDGWRYTLQYLERSIDDATTRAADGQVLPVDHSAYLRLVRALAARTAELHRALAVPTGDPAFDPEPFDAARLAEWVAQVRGEAEATLAALESRLAALPDDARELARAVLGDTGSLLGSIAGEAQADVDAVATRYHGDYHLGQVLVTRNDFVITDLEGEPGRALEERRRKSTPLKDVAGMLRSFDYARAVAARQFAARRQAEGAAGVAALLEEWRAATRVEFLAAYRAALGENGARPRARGERLLALATVERLLYEIRYELEQRPEWVAVPLRDLRAELAMRTPV
jgi:maltose alpha-D-glucosyltransferase/alpha-amylase